MGRPSRETASKLTIIRALADGHYEVQDHLGRSRFVRLLRCTQCQKLRDVGAFRRGPVCQLCLAGAEAKRRQTATDLSHDKRQLECLQKNVKKRVSTLILASPKWRDKTKIRAIYNEAKRRTIETGIQHDVDHIYPLLGEFSCGLHVHQNLQILTFKENRAKNNKYPLHESPALVAFIKQYGEHGLGKWLRWAEAGLKAADPNELRV